MARILTFPFWGGGGGAGGPVSWGDVTGKPASYPPATHGHPWSEVADQPESYPPSSHGHALGDVTGAYGRSNVLGTVSQSAGVPTGAVIERGSNANGEYVRWADGTQICTVVGPAMTADVLSGGMYRSADIWVWTYPAAWSLTPVCWATADSTWRVVFVFSGSNTASIRHWQPNSSSDGVVTRLVAIGRWF